MAFPRAVSILTYIFTHIALELVAKGPIHKLGTLVYVVAKHQGNDDLVKWRTHDTKL